MQGYERLGAARERRVLFVDERDRHGARVLRRALHGDDVWAPARLRNGDGDGVGELERRMIERGDRRPKRSAGQRDLKLDEMLEVERRMIGAATRDRHHEWRFARPQARRELSGRRRVGGQLAAHDRAGFRDLRGHERPAHRTALSLRCLTSAVAPRVFVKTMRLPELVRQRKLGNCFDEMVGLPQARSSICSTARSLCKCSI